MNFEEIESEITKFLIAFCTIIVIYFAWKSTNVNEERQPTTAVLIIENNRRRLLENVIRPQANQSSEQVNSTLEPNNSDQRETIASIQITEEAPSLQEVIDEVNDLATSTGARNISENSYQSLEDIAENLTEYFDYNNELEQQQIISDMDNLDTTEGIRRRRLAFFAQENTNIGTTETSSVQNNADISVSRRENLNVQIGDSINTENCSNENNENANISKFEEKPTNTETMPIKPLPVNEQNAVEEFRIKLKYLNDDLKLVKGRPDEEIGDFKKRNFTVELASEKLVRLVFNGHVLQPDSKTLQACGLFDNCVVHCLVHKKPTLSNNSTNRSTQSGGLQQENGASHRVRNSRAGSIFDASTNGPIFIYLGIGMVTLAVLFCWYCRIQYSSLFSLYSTIGLVLMTALFLIIFPLVILIEQDMTT